MKIPDYAWAAIAIVIAVIAGIWISDAIGFGHDPNTHCYGARC